MPDYLEVFYSVHEAQFIIEEWRNHDKNKEHKVLWATACQLRKPSFRWDLGQSCSTIKTGPLKWG